MMLLRSLAIAVSCMVMFNLNASQVDKDNKQVVEDLFNFLNKKNFEKAKEIIDAHPGILRSNAPGQGNTPLPHFYLHPYSRNLEIFEFLLTSDPSLVLYKNGLGQIPLSFALYVLLGEKPTLKEIIDASNFITLMLASNSLEQLRSTDNVGSTPLHIAAKVSVYQPGNAEFYNHLMTLMINKGADTAAKNHKGQTVFDILRSGNK